MQYAIVKTGGKQYKVEEGAILTVEKLNEAEVGKEIALDEVLLIAKDGVAAIGKPTIEGASVAAIVKAQTRAPKVLVFKRRAKKGYKKMIGHRQYVTELEITKINAN